MGKQIKLFRDIETGEIITTEQLYDEYIANDDGRELTFGEYMWNCQTSQGGTLEEIDSVKR